MSMKRLVAAALAVGLLQVGFLTWVIIGRAAVLRDGQEVLLKVEPVDPRDLLRGDYVRLGYEISRIPVSLIANAPAERLSRERPLVVRLQQGEDGYWHPKAAWLDAALAPAGSGEVDIVGSLSRWADLSRSDATVSLNFGIERFYLPEGEGKAIEKDMRVRPFAVKVAIPENGKAQIKALLDGDATLYSEPLY